MDYYEFTEFLFQPNFIRITPTPASSSILKEKTQFCGKIELPVIQIVTHVILT